MRPWAEARAAQPATTDERSGGGRCVPWSIRSRLRPGRRWSPAQQGKHRVFDFWERDFATYGSACQRQPPALPALWNSLRQAGKDVIIVNLLQTHPPEPVQGVWSVARQRPARGAFTYPASPKGEPDEVSDTPTIVPDDWL